jgi:hypothetical protein
MWKASGSSFVCENPYIKAAVTNATHKIIGYTNEKHGIKKRMNTSRELKSNVRDLKIRLKFEEELISHSNVKKTPQQFLLM